MPLLAGQGAWPSALSRARSLRLSERSRRPLTEEAGGPGAGFQQEGQLGSSSAEIVPWPPALHSGVVSFMLSAGREIRGKPSRRDSVPPEEGTLNNGTATEDRGVPKDSRPLLRPVMFMASDFA